MSGTGSRLLLFLGLSACERDAGSDGTLLTPTDGPTDSGEPTDTDTDTDSDTDTETASDTGTPTDSGTTPGTGIEVLAASCTLTANALRVTCDVTLSEPGATTLTLTAPGAPTRTFVSEGEAEQTILAWGLRADTDYDWAVGDVVGTVSTGSLPQVLAQASITVTGTSWGFDAVLNPLECEGADYFVMIDGEGDIVWYEPNGVFRGNMDGYDWSQASKTVLSVNTNRFLEQHVSGDVVLDLAGNGVDFDGNLHHDAARWGELRYLLFEYRQGNVDVDGIYVFDGAGALVGEFRLGDHFAVSGWGSFGDWSHANGLKPSETGELALSLLNFDTVVGIDGDPASPTFLQVQWQALGGGQPRLGDPDYVPIAGADEGFDGQHNASRHGDDLWVFDNRSQGQSRAIRMTMDHVAGTLALDAAWSFDRQCANHGGAIPLEGGGVLATCANSRDVWAFEEGQSTPSWTLEARCGDESGLHMARAIPVIIE